MSKKEYIQWLEERIVRLEVELYEANKKANISTYLYVTNPPIHNA
jgi:hypothetical protein